MVKGTSDKENMLLAGERLRECRKLRGMTLEQLAECIELLPGNNGKVRSAKQISYIENGTRTLSAEYALLLSEALNVRIEYLLLKDEYKTEEERIGSIIEHNSTRQDYICNLITLHGYETAEERHRASCCRLSYPPGLSGSKILERARAIKPEPIISIKSPSGSTKYMEYSEYVNLLQSIDDYIEMRLSFLFRKLTDGAKEHWR